MKCIFIWGAWLLSYYFVVRWVLGDWTRARADNRVQWGEGACYSPDSMALSCGRLALKGLGPDSSGRTPGIRVTVLLSPAIPATFLRGLSLASLLLSPPPWPHLVSDLGSPLTPPHPAFCTHLPQALPFPENPKVICGPQDPPSPIHSTPPGSPSVAGSTVPKSKPQKGGRSVWIHSA